MPEDEEEREESSPSTTKKNRYIVIVPLFQVIVSIICLIILFVICFDQRTNAFVTQCINASETRWNFSFVFLSILLGCFGLITEELCCEIKENIKTTCFSGYMLLNILFGVTYMVCSCLLIRYLHQKTKEERFKDQSMLLGLITAICCIICACCFLCYSLDQLSKYKDKVARMEKMLLEAQCSDVIKDS